MPEDYEEKLATIKSIIDNEDDIDEVLSDWELKFIEDQRVRSAITDREFSEKEKTKIDEIYEKLFTADLL